MTSSIRYLHGISNHCESEAIAGALPSGRNSPKIAPFGLYAEQINVTAFTTPRHTNLFAWVYRIRPSVLHGEFHPIKHSLFTATPEEVYTPPTQMRWNPMPYPNKPTNFINGMMAFAGNGSLAQHNGAAIYLYAINQSMQDDYFYNADGELLIVPQEGNLTFKTELGILNAMPGEVIVIPRGIKFQVILEDNQARGYVCENYGLPFRLPELGIIGANGLANPRDFLKPNACFEEREGDFTLIAKFQGKLWATEMKHSPLDVVAWHGTLAPYKYDLSLFNTIGTVSFDHPDPSIFTVLTSPSSIPGTANVDFVIFPPRWMVAENTFRPPYYHRNIMSEYMGLIHGTYDAKENDFIPGGGSLHNCMSAHGPDQNAYEKAISAASQPEYYDNTLAFMFESSQVWKLTEAAYQAEFRQKDYLHCWKNLKNNFTTTPA